MTLWVRVHCGYPSYAGSGEVWNQYDYDAYKLVQTLKGKPINGYATLKAPAGNWVKITAEAPQPAFDLFGEWGSSQLVGMGLTAGILMPIPSSDCLALGQDEKGRRLAQAIATRSPGFSVVEGLHWNVQLPKSSEGGPRDVGTLIKNLRIAQNIPKVPIVLVDDVTTSGGHLLACARGLRSFGHTVENAICAAQTVWGHSDVAMFAIPPFDLEADPLNSRV